MRSHRASREVCGGFLAPQPHKLPRQVCRGQMKHPPCCHDQMHCEPSCKRSASQAESSCSPHPTVSAAAVQSFLVASLAQAFSWDTMAYASIDEHGKYVPSPVDGPGWEIWFGSIVGVIPFIIASYEFGKRIVIQRRCAVCGGKGLVKKGKYWKKCTQCGGMLPWLGWRAFWFSNLRPGNGGPLMRPKPAGERTNTTDSDDIPS
ncbi:hypothetical protein PSENEW3n2_00005200 [Picochlorum sp. SENEW3]|nr:hypothetical protein PSENEW3n2_00005200 [Picochlorum sp. SENEW3]WPT17195.1 hypothetical protein PSENEW3_00005200 [Picochlorum sp. SENEW3]